MLQLGLTPSGLAGGRQPAFAVRKSELHGGLCSGAEGVRQGPSDVRNAVQANVLLDVVEPSEATWSESTLEIALCNLNVPESTGGESRAR